MVLVDPLLTKKLCTAREDLDILTSFLGFPDDCRVFFLPTFLGSGRLCGDSEEVRRGLARVFIEICFMS